MKTIFHLILIVAGFLGGIYIGVHHPDWGSKIDEMRAEEQDKLQAKVGPQINQARIEALNAIRAKLAGTPTPGTTSLPGGGAGFTSGGGTPTSPQNAAAIQAIDDEIAKLKSGQK